MKKINIALLNDVPPRSTDKPTYTVIQRGFSPACIHLLKELRRDLGIEHAEASGDVPESEVIALLNRVAERAGIEITRVERDEILSEIERDRRPFGILQELVDDPSVSDIIVTNYSCISVQQSRRNFSTGLAFVDQESYEAFVERLLQHAQTTYSTKQPIADGTIGGYARVHAVHSSLCESGPYLTVRLNRFSRVSGSDLVKAALAPVEIISYLQALIKNGQTVLIVGEVGTGKTTLARALASSVPHDESILVIEDTPEIRLDHPHVRYISTREANIEGSGRVAPSECIRAGMRMAMNRIIFGEIRDAEAAEAFVDVCASGHPGLSTIHARSAAEAMTRLELFLARAQRGTARDVLSEQIVTAVQAIVFINICKQTGKRRIMEIKEIGPVADGVIRQRDIFRYQAQGGIPTWKVINRLSAYRDALEGGEDPVILSKFPAVLELGREAVYQEVLRG